MQLLRSVGSARLFAANLSIFKCGSQLDSPVRRGRRCVYPPTVHSQPTTMSTQDLSLPIQQLNFEASPLAVVQIKPSEPIPPALLEAITQSSEFLSITRTRFETSVVLPWEECESAFAQVKVSEERCSFLSSNPLHLR